MVLHPGGFAQLLSYLLSYKEMEASLEGVGASLATDSAFCTSVHEMIVSLARGFYSYSQLSWSMLWNCSVAAFQEIKTDASDFQTVSQFQVCCVCGRYYLGKWKAPDVHPSRKSLFSHCSTVPGAASFRSRDTPTLDCNRGCAKTLCKRVCHGRSGLLLLAATYC